jgi:hypothetical protein
MPVFRHNDRLSDILILGNLKGLVNAFNSESAVSVIQPWSRWAMHSADGTPLTALAVCNGTLHCLKVLSYDPVTSCPECAGSRHR